MVGSFIGVRDQFWCFAIETCISYSVLSGFIVDNNHDAQTFKVIARDVFHRIGRNNKIPTCFTFKMEVWIYVCMTCNVSI